MKKAAGNLDVLVKIAGGIFGACAWVLVIVGVLLLLIGERMYDAGSVSLDLDYVSLYLSEGIQVGFAELKAAIAAGLIVSGIVCHLVGRGAKLVRRMLAAMKEGRPFDTDTPASLRKIAWMTLAGGALVQIAGILDRVVYTRVLPMEQIFSSPVIAQVEYNYTFDLGFVWVAIVIFFLSYVFDYGRKLQEESDETL